MKGPHFTRIYRETLCALLSAGDIAVMKIDMARTVKYTLEVKVEVRKELIVEALHEEEE